FRAQMSHGLSTISWTNTSVSPFRVQSAGSSPSPGDASSSGSCCPPVGDTENRGDGPREDLEIVRRLPSGVQIGKALRPPNVMRVLGPSDGAWTHTSWCRAG